MHLGGGLMRPLKILKHLSGNHQIKAFVSERNTLTTADHVYELCRLHVQRDITLDLSIQQWTIGLITPAHVEHVKGSTQVSHPVFENDSPRTQNQIMGIRKRGIEPVAGNSRQLVTIHFCRDYTSMFPDECVHRRSKFLHPFVWHRIQLKSPRRRPRQQFSQEQRICAESSRFFPDAIPSRRKESRRLRDAFIIVGPTASGNGSRATEKLRSGTLASASSTSPPAISQSQTRMSVFTSSSMESSTATRPSRKNSKTRDIVCAPVPTAKSRYTCTKIWECIACIACGESLHS